MGSIRSIPDKIELIVPTSIENYFLRVIYKLLILKRLVSLANKIRLIFNELQTDTADQRWHLVQNTVVLWPNLISLS